MKVAYRQLLIVVLAFFTVFCTVFSVTTNFAQAQAESLTVSGKIMLPVNSENEQSFEAEITAVQIDTGEVQKTMVEMPSGENSAQYSLNLYKDKLYYITYNLYGSETFITSGMVADYVSFSQAGALPDTVLQKGSHIHGKLLLANGAAAQEDMEIAVEANYVFTKILLPKGANSTTYSLVVPTGSEFKLFFSILSGNSEKYTEDFVYSEESGMFTFVDSSEQDVELKDYTITKGYPVKLYVGLNDFATSKEDMKFLISPKFIFDANDDAARTFNYEALGLGYSQVYELKKGENTLEVVKYLPQGMYYMNYLVFGETENDISTRNLLSDSSNMRIKFGVSTNVMNEYYAYFRGTAKYYDVVDAKVKLPTDAEGVQMVAPEGGLKVNMDFYSEKLNVDASFNAHIEVVIPEGESEAVFTIENMQEGQYLIDYNLAEEKQKPNAEDRFRQVINKSQLTYDGLLTKRLVVQGGDVLGFEGYLTRETRQLENTIIATIKLPKGMLAREGGYKMALSVYNGDLAESLNNVSVIIPEGQNSITVDFSQPPYNMIFPPDTYDIYFTCVNENPLTLYPELDSSGRLVDESGNYVILRLAEDELNQVWVVPEKGSILLSLKVDTAEAAMAANQVEIRMPEDVEKSTRWYGQIILWKEDVNNPGQQDWYNIVINGNTVDSTDGKGVTLNVNETLSPGQYWLYFNEIDESRLTNYPEIDWNAMLVGGGMPVYYYGAEDKFIIELPKVEKENHIKVSLPGGVGYLGVLKGNATIRQGDTVVCENKDVIFGYNKTTALVDPGSVLPDGEYTVTIEFGEGKDKYVDYVQFDRLTDYKFVVESGKGEVSLPSNIPSKTYYVSSSGGNDANDGLTPETAWKSYANFTGTNGFLLNAGDSLLFKRGDTFEGQFILTGKGTLNDHITLGAYGEGNKPVFTHGPESSNVNLYFKKFPVITILNASYWDISDLVVKDGRVGIYLRYTEAGHKEVSISNCEFYDFTDVYATFSGANDSLSQTGFEYAFASGIFLGGPVSQTMTDKTILDRFHVTDCVFDNCDRGIGNEWYYPVFYEKRITNIDFENIRVKRMNIGAMALNQINGGTIRNVTVETTNTDFYVEHGIAAIFMHGVSDVVVDNLKILELNRGKSPDGAGIDFEFTKRVTVQNSYFGNIDGMAIEMLDTPATYANVGIVPDYKYAHFNSDIVFDNCIFFNTARTTHILEGNAEDFAYDVYTRNPRSNGTVKNCTFYVGRGSNGAMNPKTFNFMAEENNTYIDLGSLSYYQLMAIGAQEGEYGMPGGGLATWQIALICAGSALVAAAAAVAVILVLKRKKV